MLSISVVVSYPFYSPESRQALELFARQTNVHRVSRIDSASNEAFSYEAVGVLSFYFRGAGEAVDGRAQRELNGPLLPELKQHEGGRTRKVQR